MHPRRSLRRPSTPGRLFLSLLATVSLTAAACSDDDGDVVVTDPPAGEATPGASPEPTGSDASSEPTPTGDGGDEPTSGPGTAEPTPADPNSEGGGDTSDPGTTDPDAEPGQPGGPGGEASIDVVVTCATGSVTSESPIPAGNIEQIDDVVNTIDFCEGAGGLASVAFVAPCGSGDRDVVVEAVAGALPDIATLDLCEDEG